MHVTIGGEVGTADVAAEGALPGVDEHVSVEGAVAAELLLADAAAVDFGAVVGFDDAVVLPDVLRKFVLVRQLLLAHGAVEATSHRYVSLALTPALHLHFVNLRCLPFLGPGERLLIGQQPALCRVIGGLETRCAVIGRLGSHVGGVRSWGCFG